MVLSLGGIVSGIQNLFQEGNLRCSGRKDQIRHRVYSMELGDDLEGVPLVDQEALAFRRIVHFLSVFRDERVEKGIEPLVVSALGTKNPSESLGFLTTRAKVGGDLDEASGFGEIDRGVSNLT